MPETFLMLGEPPEVRVPLKPCCREVLDGEECDCAEMAQQMQSAPELLIGTGWYR